jgi:O-antigen/teichoic acid export membrane protein
LKKNEIRLHYSGFIIFAAQILSVITGLVFTLLLTRNMTKQEYGIWANIFDLVNYFLLLSGIFPFWAIRFIARGKQGAAKTGLLANLVISLISTTFYVALTPLLTGAFHIGGPYVLMYLIAFAQIINLHLILILESVLRATKPQAVGYGLLIEETTKLVLAYVLIIRLQQLFLGALLSIIIAAAVQTLFYISITRKELKQKIQWTYVREWLKGSTANLYNAVGSQLASTTIIMLFLLGGQEARGNYQAALTFANVIGYSLFLSYALYPKLLAENNLKDATSSLKTVLMFAIPITTIIMVTSPSLLIVLNIKYSEAQPILLLLAIDTFVLLLQQFYTSVIFGTEKLDEKATIPLRKLAGSKIFKVFTLPYLQAAISLPTTFIILTQFASGQPVLAAVYVTAINLAAHGMILLIQYAMMHNSVPIPIPWKNIAKYLLASAVAGAALSALPDTTTLTLTFATVLLGIAAYAAILLAIDREARTLVAAIWNEIKNIATGHANEQA